MPSERNRNKIYTVLVLCAGIIISVWLVDRKPADAIEKKNTASVIAIQNPAYSGPEDDTWKNILTKIDTNSVKTTNVVAGDTYDAGTITAQMARDFFSQYLLTVKDGGSLTTDQANIISERVLSIPEYTKTQAVVYIPANIHMVQKTDAETVKTYHQKLNAYLKVSSEQIKDDPIVILATALQKNSEKELKRLDPLIVTGRTLIKNLLSMEVPANVSGAHILLLNSFSSILADVEAMRISLDDPVKAFTALGQYQKDASNLQIVLEGIETLLNEKSR